MYYEANVLKRRDVASLRTVEGAFRDGPIAAALRTAPSIERRRNLDANTFECEYRRGIRPVILQGAAASWPAVREWSFKGLAERCGDTRVVVDSYSSQRAREATFSEFVQLLEENTGNGAAPLYLQEWYYQEHCAQLAADLPELDIAQYDFRRELYGEAVSTNHQLWIGQKGGITRLHQDSYMVDVMHVQLVGTKRWSVMGPYADLSAVDDGPVNFDSLVENPETQLMQCVLEPGDVLYLPAQWFHRIELLEDSMGLGRKCLDPMHLKLHVRQRMAELLAIALNAEEVKETHPELFNVVMARNRTWARRMKIDLSKLRP